MRRSRRTPTVDPEPVNQLAQSARELWEGLTPEQRAKVYEVADRALDAARETFSAPPKRRRLLRR